MELKDISTYLGIEAENLDDFKQKFSSIYDKKGTVDREAVAHEVGRLKGTWGVELKRIAKDNGIEFEPDELKDKKLEDIFGLTLAKYKSMSEDAIQKIKDESRKSKPADIQEWEGKVSKLNDKIGQLEATNNLLKDEMAKKEQAYLGEIKNTKLGLQEESLWNSVKFRHDLDDITKLGFKSYIKSNYKIDLDDKDQIVITDKEGKFIPDSTKHGAFKSATQVITEEALNKKLLEKNPDGGRKMNLPTFATPKPDEGENPVRPIARRY